MLGTPYHHEDEVEDGDAGGLPAGRRWGLRWRVKGRFEALLPDASYPQM